jgi:hypothetical protein
LNSLLNKRKGSLKMNSLNTIRAEGERAGFDSEIDHILAAEDELIPTSGFLAAVMEQVQEQVIAPPPIPFPWKRTIPAILTIIGIFGWGGFELVRLGPPVLAPLAQNSFTLLPMHIPSALAASANQIEWVALALGVSLLSWLFARHLAGRGGLL